MVIIATSFKYIQIHYLKILDFIKSLCNISSYFHGRIYLYCILLGEIKMNGICTTDKLSITPKEIGDVPYSSEVDYRIFSRVLNDTVASYKLYWLLALLDEISERKSEIEFKKLICKNVPPMYLE